MARILQARATITPSLNSHWSSREVVSLATIWQHVTAAAQQNFRHRWKAATKRASQVLPFCKRRAWGDSSAATRVSGVSCEPIPPSASHSLSSAFCLRNCVTTSKSVAPNLSLQVARVCWLSGQSEMVSSPIFLLSKVTESPDAYMPFRHLRTGTFKENCIVHCSLWSSVYFFLLCSIACAKCPVFFHSRSFHVMAGCKSKWDVHFTRICTSIYQRVAHHWHFLQMHLLTKSVVLLL